MNWFDCALPIRITDLSRPKLHGFGRHTGVLLEWPGGGFVVDRQSGQGIRRVSYEDFAQGRPVAAGMAIEDPEGIAQAFDRMVKSIENLPGYDLFKRNCEHFVRTVIFNEDRSPQIDGVLFLGALVMTILVLSPK